MDFLFAKNKPFNIASIQQEDGGERSKTCSSRNGQEHMKRNTTMMNKGEARNKRINVKTH
jgi:hypothetical protein